MASLADSYTFVDIETTGCNPRLDRIIEIAAIKISKQKISQEFHTLVNPRCYLPKEITAITGITQAEVEQAPIFEDIAGQIDEILRDSIFVAHNVRFDYGFLRQEYNRLGMSMRLRQLCTVKLSRKLFPQYRRHNLDAIIERFGFPVQFRHRAFDDANIILKFFQKLPEIFSEEYITEVVQTVLKKPAIPAALDENKVMKIPQNPGVYIFYGSEGNPLYIGKSINLRDRIMAHFEGDNSSVSEMKIAQQISSYEVIPTAGEFSALVLESELIKKQQPLYNKLLRHKKLVYVTSYELNDEGYYTVQTREMTHITLEILDTIIGIHSSKKQVNHFLQLLYKTHNLCQKLMKIEKSKGSCFGYKLGICTGACIKKESALKYNLRFIEAVSVYKIKKWPYVSPVLIMEKNCNTNNYVQHIIDKWCYLGTIYQQGQALQSTYNHSYEFDRHMYHIILRYITNPKNKKNIHLLGNKKVEELVEGIYIAS